MPYVSTSDLYPLPIPHHQRTKPEHFIPVVEDETGHADLIWRILLNLKLGLGKFSGRPFGEVAQEWQRRLVYAIYGPTNLDGERLVSEVFFTVSKKNGKSSFLALIAVAHALAMPKPDARMMLLASTKDQAGIVYAALKSAIEQDPTLLKQFNVRDYRSDAVHYDTQTLIRCISPDLHSTTGELPELYICDELHLIGRKPVGAAMIRQLSSGLVATGGIGVSITTAPIAGQPAAGVYLGQYNRAKRILAGESDGETLLPICFELPDEADPHDQSIWWMANPSLGTTVTKQWLNQQYEIAKTDSDPSVLAEFFSQHLNLRSDDIVAGVDGWAIARVWTQHDDPRIDLNALIRSGGKLFAGIDAGGQNDLTGLVLLADTPDGYLLWSHAWLTTDGYEANGPSKPFYDDCIERGELTIVSALGEDLDGIEDILRRVPNLAQIGVDPYGLQELIERAELLAPVCAIAQGFKISPYLEGFEREVFAGRVRHHDSKLLSWCVGNTLVETKTAAKSIRKRGDQHSPLKIDLAICSIMAYAASQAEAVAPSVYDSAAMIM